MGEPAPDALWDRIEAARLILGWSESKFGAELLNNRTGYTKIKERDFGAHGRTLVKILDGLELQGFQKDWIMRGTGKPRNTSAAERPAKTRQEIALAVLAEFGTPPAAIDAALEHHLELATETISSRVHSLNRIIQAMHTGGKELEELRQGSGRWVAQQRYASREQAIQTHIRYADYKEPVIRAAADAVAVALVAGEDPG
jgi:hypothetical protein